MTLEEYKNLRPGQFVLCTGDPKAPYCHYTIGKMYVVKCTQTPWIVTTFDDYGSNNNGLRYCKFETISLLKKVK